MNDNELRAAAVREAARYIERVTRPGLISRAVILLDLEAAAERMEKGMTARGSTRVVAEEPEWEYGVRATGDTEPFTDHYESLDAMSEEFDGRVVWNTDEEIVRRRKAGPWVEVPDA